MDNLLLDYVFGISHRYLPVCNLTLHSGEDNSSNKYRMSTGKIYHITFYKWSKLDLTIYKFISLLPALPLDTSNLTFLV